MKLPNAERAYVDLQKLIEYSLSMDHEFGKNKAVVFQSALGLTAADAATLKVAIVNAVIGLEAEELGTNRFGVQYRVDFEMTTDVGTATVRTGWIVRTGEDFPRLTTCFVI